MHDGSPSSRGRASFLSGWFRRAATVAALDQHAVEQAPAPSAVRGDDPVSTVSTLLFMSPAAEERDSFTHRVRAVSGQVGITTRASSDPLTLDAAAMAAIVVDCRQDHDAIMRILGELELLGASTRPLVVPLIRSTRADKAWAIAIGADDILVDPFDDADLTLLLKAAGHSADLHRENARLRSGLDEVSRDAQGLRTLAYTDHLTGLPNRLYLVTWLNEIIARHDADLQFAVHMLDLDGFKLVNDQYGHRAGDEILKEVSRRVTRICRRLDLVVRLGGDEMVIVQAGVVSGEDCRAFTSRVLQTFQHPFVVDDMETSIGASIGSAIYPADGERVSELLHRADLAMYAAKPPGMERTSPAESDRSSRMMVDRQDMDRGSYAPAFTLANGMLAGLVCVAAGSDEAGAPDAGLRLLRLACLQSGLGPAEQPGVFFAARIGHDVLANDDLVSSLRDLLTDTNAEPARCEILITASELDRDPELWHQLRELGYGLGVLVETDDFSPQRLLRVPLTRLHLGASFFGSQSRSTEAGVLLDLAVMFARAVYAETLAQGLTTLEQLAVLRKAGVNCAAGLLAGAPVLGSDLPSLRQDAAHDWTEVAAATS